MRMVGVRNGVRKGERERREAPEKKEREREREDEGKQQRRKGKVVVSEAGTEAAAKKWRGLINIHDLDYTMLHARSRIFKRVD